MLYLFSRWHPLERNFTFSVGLGDTTVFNRSVSISKPNFIVIAQYVNELSLFLVWKNKLPPY